MEYHKTHARISDCGRFRYILSRRWGEVRHELDTVVFCMLNPSTADGTQDDPTIRRCVGYADAWGYRRLVVVNLFAFRATDPKALLSAADPVGPFNDEAIEEVCFRGRTVVLAWGAFADDLARAGKRLGGRPREVVRIVASSGGVPKCLGLTKNQHPRHPLYAPEAASLQDL